MSEHEDWRKHLTALGFDTATRPDVVLTNAKSAFLHQHHEQLSDIQQSAINPIYHGENALLISSTASGKTEAACIPIAAKVSKNSTDSLCIYLAPTKALLNDIYKRLTAPLHRLGLIMAIRHGDKPLLSTNDDVAFLLTTPESLDVLLCRDFPILSKVDFVICDEIHQVFGTPRGLQMVFLLERVAKSANRKVQRAALSATVGDPSAAAEWLKGGGDPVRVFSSGAARPIDPDLHWLGDVDSLADTVLKSGAKKLLVFVNSRRKCDDLFLKLNQLSPYQVFVHYSTLDKEQREYVESQFKASEFAICIATTTLELGIDIGSVEAVILYDPPSSVSSFLQRIGRGGRRAGKTWVIMTPKNDLELLQFCALTALASEGIVETVPPGQFYSVVVQQIFSSVAAKHHHRVHLKEIEELCSSFPWILPGEIASIMQGLSTKGYLIHEPEWSSYQMGPMLRTLFNDGAIFSNISSGESGIQIICDGRRMASLPLPPSRVRLGATILFAGRYWEITSVGEGRVSVRLTHPVGSPIRPLYGRGGGSYTSPTLANRIRDVMFEEANPSHWSLDRATEDRLRVIKATVPSRHSGRCIFRATGSSKYYYYTFAGGLENAVLQLLFSKLGHECQVMKDAEGVAICSNESLDFSRIPEGENEIRGAVQEHWRTFSRLASKGPFFELVPGALRRKEVLSQIDYGCTIPDVVDTQNRPIIDIPSRLF